VSNKDYYRYMRWKAWTGGEDEVAEYRSRDYDNAMTEISHLVGRVNNGDVSLVNSGGFAVPRDLNCIELWTDGDDYHSKFPRITHITARKR